MSSLTLETASAMIDSALKTGREKKFMPLCVVVLDAGAHMIAMKREDGASISRPEIAAGKAAGCLGMGMGGRALAKRYEAAPGLFVGAAAIMPKGVVPVAGGVLVRDGEGKIIGAIGISGDVSDNDEICAVAGVEAVGLKADTGA